MGKCLVIGTIHVPATVGQAILVNGKLCTEETLWSISAYGGESHATDFTLENRANVGFDITWEISQPTDGEYSAGVYESDGVTAVSSPTHVNAHETKNWVFKVDFDKHISEGDYDIYIRFKFEGD